LAGGLLFDEKIRQLPSKHKCLVPAFFGTLLAEKMAACAHTTRLPKKEDVGDIFV
jgi:hypothetical protein